VNLSVEFSIKPMLAVDFSRVVAQPVHWLLQALWTVGDNETNQKRICGFSAHSKTGIIYSQVILPVGDTVVFSFSVDFWHNFRLAGLTTVLPTEQAHPAVPHSTRKALYKTPLALEIPGVRFQGNFLASQLYDIRASHLKGSGTQI
jgi:hypothetical protein